MFTGLVENIGTIKSIESNTEGKCLVVKSSLAHELNIDDSVSINGACQTVIAKNEDSFTVQAVHITLQKTGLGNLKMNDPVNLELALKASDRLGGHMVQGHINDIAQVKSINEIGKNREIWFEVPNELDRYIIQEGSIAVDGISLTVAHKRPSEFMVTIIPHTFTKTNIQFLKLGDKVNIEVDILGKYIESLIMPYINEQIKPSRDLNV